MRTTFPARLTDPITSHEAAPTADHCLVVKGRILEILTANGPLTHDGIRRHYIAQHGLTSAQNIRSRTSELERDYRVRAVDRDGQSPTGRRATRWDVWREDS